MQVSMDMPLVVQFRLHYTVEDLSWHRVTSEIMLWGRACSRDIRRLSRLVK
jgi:hypothetical protein